MRDNKTSQAASQYDDNVYKTIPRYHLFHEETLDLVKTAMPHPQSWLDTGCGTGTLILKALDCFGPMRITAADPSEGMLSIAKDKLSDHAVTYILAGSEDICCTGSFDIVTAIMAHHYLNSELRKKATQNCFKMLKKGGMYITFETIKASSNQGTQIGLKRWHSAQVANGKSSDAADKHISRYGSEILPITIEEHSSVLKNVGFSTVEILWVSGMQAGFYGIK